jgi:hypothetical protein
LFFGGANGERVQKSTTGTRALKRAETTDAAPPKNKNEKR